jgi:transposase-like protein
MSLDECLSPIARLTAEGLVPVAAAARKLGVHPASVRRWCLRGASTATGGRVRLEHVRLPGKLLTTLAAVERFTQAIGSPIATAPAVRSPAKRNKAADAAEAELRRMGV